MLTMTDLDTLSINTIRTLAMDAVQQANSGHPGTPMAMAPVAYALWQRHLRFDPEHPIWPDRDRFVLSMGHASMLLYSLLHLAGVKAVNPKYETPGLAKGAYVLADAPGGSPEVLLIGTGSEVSLCVAAHDALSREGIRSRVVSMPSWELFDDQPAEYREGVLPPSVKARVAVEQGSTLGWERYVGSGGHVIGMKTFGASAPLKELQKKFGFEPARVVAAAKQQLARG
jgi:transketolase